MKIEYETTLFIRMGTDEIVDEEAFGALEEDITVSGDAVAYVAARVNGDPDDCHEAEGGYVEDVRVTRDDTGKEIDVPDAVLNDLVREAEEYAADEEEGAAEAAAEDAYERRREMREDY